MLQICVIFHVKMNSLLIVIYIYEPLVLLFFLCDSFYNFVNYHFLSLQVL